MSTIDHFIHDNQRYAATYPGARPVRPRLQVAVVTCMDSRLDLFGALGLSIGDAHVLRNAGGVVTEDVLRSLAISQRKLGTREIVLIHHTDCGMFNFDDEQFRAELTAETGVAPAWRVAGFTDLKTDVAESMERIRQCPWLPHRDSVHGFIFDVATARIIPVGTDNPGTH